jgi:anti-sigma B factor antagonist
MARVSLTRLGGSLSAVVLDGEFDLSNMQEVVVALNEAIDDPDTRAVAVDLSLVGFLDSKMLQALVTARDRAQEALKPVWLVRPEDRIWRVFQITMLDKLFRDFATMAELEAYARDTEGKLSAS